MTTADPIDGISADPQCIRIVQVSDTHVSRKRAYFVDNWDVFVDEMSRTRPDPIIHVAFDGAADEDDQRAEHALPRALPRPRLAVQAPSGLAGNSGPILVLHF